MSDVSKGRAASIFVSYRIADTLQTADRLAAELKRTFGPDEVFFDRRTIEPGEAWDSRIGAAVKGAKVVLVLIGKQWLTVQGDYGVRRLDESGDWVRREVEEALTVPGRVVPVLVDDASPPRAAAFANLPNMAGLASCTRLRPAAFTGLAVPPLQAKPVTTNSDSLVDSSRPYGPSRMTFCATQLLHRRRHAHQPRVWGLNAV